MNRIEAALLRRVTRPGWGTSHGNPDTVRNATVLAAVLGAAAGPSHALTRLLGGVHPPPPSSPFGLRELNPVSCALIRADTAVLFTIVSMMHIKQNKTKKRKNKKTSKFLKTKKSECLKHLRKKYSLTNQCFLSVYLSVCVT